MPTFMVTVALETVYDLGTPGFTLRIIQWF